MKDIEIAEDFRKVVELAEVYEAASLRVGFSEEEPSYPCTVFECLARPIAGSAHFLTCEIRMTTCSEPNDAGLAAHAERTEKLRVLFFGRDQSEYPAARAAIKTAFQGLGHFRMLGRGHDAPAEPSTAAAESTLFKTPLTIACSVEVLPPI